MREKRTVMVLTSETGSGGCLIPFFKGNVPSAVTKDEALRQKILKNVTFPEPLGIGWAKNLN